MERLDKIIANAKNISRNDAKVLIKKGLVSVDGKAIKNANEKCDESLSIVVDGEEVQYSEFVYIMMNKPGGVVSASEGKNHTTVVDILPDEMKRNNLFPAGRLDKDTTGFVLITNDGQFAHNILSPKKHVSKTYIAKLDKPFDDEVKKAFEDGVELKNEKCLSATVESLNAENTVAKVVIHQGMYHQVKRMFARFGITVVELKRIKIGELLLDDSLKEGQSRYISKDEKELITKKFDK